MFAYFIRRLTPLSSADQDVVRPRETLAKFVWRTSGAHQFYVGALAVGVSLLNFAPIDLQRRIVDGPIAARDVGGLIFLALLYLGVVLIQSALKYALMVYQSWVSESAIKISRDHLVSLAAERPQNESSSSGETVNVISREIDSVGGFVGASISEFVVNFSFLIFSAAYMLYVQPLIALVSAIFLAPQLVLAPLLQARLNDLYERQVGLIRRLGDETVKIAEADAREGVLRSTAIGAIYWNRLRFHFLKFGLKTLLNIANALAPLSVLAIGGYMVIHDQTTIGVVLAFVSGFERLSNPLRDLLNFYRDYEQAMVQHQMILGWVEAPQNA